MNRITHAVHSATRMQCALFMIDVHILCKIHAQCTRHFIHFPEIVWSRQSAFQSHTTSRLPPSSIASMLIRYRRHRQCVLLRIFSSRVSVFKLAWGSLTMLMGNKTRTSASLIGVAPGAASPKSGLVNPLS